jgi:hypothetical protein
VAANQNLLTKKFFYIFSAAKNSLAANFNNLAAKIYIQ